VEISDLIAPDRVIVGSKATSKSHLLAEVARRAAAATGLPALAAISRRLRDQTSASDLRSAKSPSEVYETLIRT